MKALALILLAATTAAAQPIDSMIERELPSLIDTYKTLHTSPEVSMQEEKTSAMVATQLRALGYTVADHIGDYQQAGKTCYGVVAMMKNGDGPVVLVRTDMDALPVQEQTGLPYASRIANVMHACGHDIHMATLIGTATILAQIKDRWHGTVMLIGQPAEEVVQGAAAMMPVLHRLPGANRIMGGTPCHAHDVLQPRSRYHRRAHELRLQHRRLSAGRLLI